MSANEPTKPTPPRPGPPAVPMPRKAPTPAAVAPVASVPAASSTSAEWGRVSEDGTVEVKEGDAWRVVGQYPDGTPDEALAYFVRKFDDIAFKVQTLEQRHQAGGASAGDLAKQAAHLIEEATDGRRRRRSRRTARSAQRAHLVVVGSHRAGGAAGQGARRQGDRRAHDPRRARRGDRRPRPQQGAVEAGQPPSSASCSTPGRRSSRTDRACRRESPSSSGSGSATPVRSSTSSAVRSTPSSTMRTRQRATRRPVWSNAPRHSPPVARTASPRIATSSTSGRHPGAPDARPTTPSGTLQGCRRRSLRRACRAGRCGRGGLRAEDRGSRGPPRRGEGRRGRVEHQAGRALLTRIQRQWDEIGRVFPREKERALDDKLRAIEQALKGREDVDWKKNNPETKARANDMSSQLLEAIEKLEAEVAAAEKAVRQEGCQGRIRRTRSATRLVERPRQLIRSHSSPTSSEEAGCTAPDWRDAPRLSLRPR